jgi:hypothetical protein
MYGLDDGFDWDGDSDVVVKPVLAVAIYANGDGEVCIRQQHGSMYDDGDGWLIIPANQVKAVIAGLKQAAAKVASVDGNH